MKKDSRDAVVYARLKSTHLAEFVRYFTEQGIDVYTKSDLIDLVFENLRNILISRADPPMRVVNNSTEAMEILRAHGLMVPLKDRKQHRLLENLQDESIKDVGKTDTEEDLDALAKRIWERMERGD